MWRLFEPFHAVIYFAPEKKEFYDRARKRLDEALRNISELEERMARRVGHGHEGKRKAAG